MNSGYLKIHNKLKIPFYSFGNERKILLIAGVHGDEKTGPMLLRQFIKKIQRTKKNYPLTILPVVNPRAYNKNSRVNPIDKKDLNRIFPVNHKSRTESFIIAKKLQSFAEQFDIIIDFHVFNKQNTLVCGVDLNKNQKIQSKVKSIMKKLNLEAVCRIDHKNEPKKDGSLCGYLQTKNKIAFGIELPPQEVLTKKQFKDILRGLVRFIQDRNVRNRPLKTYIRQQYYSKARGYFTPIKSPGQNINRGEAVGMLRSGKKDFPVISPFQGKLISISYPRLVGNNEKTFVIGKLVEDN